MDKDENAEWLFGGNNGDNGEWEAHRRFITSTYNPIYRQGVLSAHHLSEAKFSEFLRCAKNDLKAATAIFLDWVRTDRPQGGDYGDVAMERLAARAPSFDAETALGVVSVFADVMDDYYRIRPKREMFVDNWEASESIIRTFRTSVPDFAFGAVADRIARDGLALAWLTAVIGRSEIWAHGLAGDRAKEEALRLLNRPQLDRYISTLASRIAALTSGDILALPRMGRVLFTLHDSPEQSAQGRKILRRLAGPRSSDESFIAFLEAMAGVVISSDRGIYFTLSTKDLQILLGEDEFTRRWSRLVEKKLEPSLEARRSKILKMFADAKDW